MKKFALIGAAGYIAPRHMKSIKEVGGDLVAALDPHDSVGVLDKYFPECNFFKDVSLLGSWVTDHPIDYLVVCSPNYAHRTHCLLGLQWGADVICEKPLVLYEAELDRIAWLEKETGKKVSVIMQCRLHPKTIRAKHKYREGYHDVCVKYVAPRGPWYEKSWKGDTGLSGGLTTNIGVHLFDLSLWMFGEFNYCDHLVVEQEFAQGSFGLKRARVKWELSTKQGVPSRIFRVGDEEIDLTTGFEDLHAKSYDEVLSGRGFGIEDVRQSTRMVEAMRNESD